MKELQKWIKENCLNSINNINGELVKNNGKPIELKFPEIHKEIISATSHLEEIYQDFSFSKRLHYILNNQKHIKRWVKKESFYLKNLKFWIEDALFDCNRTLNQAFLRNDNIRIKNRFPLLYNKCVELTSFLPANSSLIQRLWHIYNDEWEIPLCEFCLCNNCNFYNFRQGYGKFCSQSCMGKGTSYKSKQTKLERYGDENYINIQKTKETCLKKFGVGCPLQNEQVKEKIRETNIEKYGVDNPWKSEDIKLQIKESKLEKYGDPNFNNQEKIKQTKLEKYGDPNFNNRELYKKNCLEKHGVSNTAKLAYVMQSIRLTNIEKYGVDNTWKREDIKLQIRNKIFSIYGVDYPLQSEVIKNNVKSTNFEKYGVTHHMHVPEIAEKCLGWHKNSWHEYTLPSGKVIKLQGFEPKALDILLTEYSEDEILYKRSDMPRLFYTDTEGKERRYYPDFYIPKENLLIEVKSSYTYEASLEKNLLKEQCAIDHGFDYRWMIL